MFSSKKPLFSRPVLAVIMVLSTFAIWALNLTSSGNKLPTPHIETWTTSSNIPVTWLEQDSWKGSNKLELRFVFNAPSSAPMLTQATLAILMSDSLPLSTSSINQRLAPLAAKASSTFHHEGQTIGLTLNNEKSYLIPTLSLITQWLKKPVFKPRTLENWQSMQKDGQQIRHTLEHTLFYNKESSEMASDKPVKMTAEQLAKYYQTLQNQVSGIYIVGYMDKETQTLLKKSLDDLSQVFKVSSSHQDSLIPETQSLTIRENNGEQIWQTQSAIALSPLNSTQEWISLRLWGTDLVQTLNQQDYVDFVQLTLTLSPQHPWAWWSIQHKNKSLLETPNSITTTLSESATQDLPPKAFIFVEQVPSANNSKAFNMLFDHFRKQLATQVLSPTWWSNIATQVTSPDSQLTLTQFANSYNKAVDTYTQDDYRNALIRLLKTSSYQEIQVLQ